MKDMKRSRWAGALTLAPALLAWACGTCGNGVSRPMLGSSVNVAGSWIGTWRLDIEEKPEFGPDLVLGGSVRLSLRLQEEAGLPERPEVPLLGLVGRLVRQKGIDVLAACLQRVLDLDLQLVLLGTGDRDAAELRAAPTRGGPAGRRRRSSRRRG